MKLKFLLLAALLGGLVSFAWGSVAHVSNLFPSITPRPFADSTGVVQFMKANAPENGVYFEGRGLLAVVSFRSDLGPRFPSLVAPLLKQLLVEIGVAFLLAWVLLRLPLWPAWGTGSLFATLGLAAGIAQLFPEGIWYGFPMPFVLAEIAILVIGWFLMGWVIGALRNRIFAAAA